ncbi:MAG: hypothetical protein ABIT71_20000 [Vicinamibacteraceae bacterium]
MRSTALALVLACLVAAPAAADVTVTATTTGKAPVVGDLSGTQTTRIKGNRMRIDSAQGDRATALILDIEGQRMISIDEKKREATIMPAAKLQEALSKTTTGEVKASVTPTAETKTIAGLTCKVHQVSVEVPFSMGGPEMQMALVMSGPACLSKDAPGYADYVRLYTAVADKGFVLGDPRSTQGPGAAMAKGMASFQKTMAAAGIALDQNMHAELKGEGPMAGVMGRFFKLDAGHVVTKIETGDVDASIFEVPAGYKVKQN